jgi:hypothetical protein
MIDELKKVRQNYWAITVAAVASFVFEAVWYSVFLKAWLAGIGRTMESLMATGVNPALQYATALLMAWIIAAAISCVTQLTGPQTARRGIKVGALLWTGCVVTTWGTEYAFEVRTYSIFAINVGFWLIAMVLMGAIVGAWKKK